MLVCYQLPSRVPGNNTGAQTSRAVQIMNFDKDPLKPEHFVQLCFNRTLIKIDFFLVGAYYVLIQTNLLAY